MSEIAVVLPVYNGLRYLEQNIQSVLQQQYKDFVFLICDDHSTDGSWEYLNTINDPRISLYRNQQNKGLFPTLNFLCKQADTRLIKIWSQDDVMYPPCLGETVSFHKKYPAISFSYSAFEVIDEDGRVVSREFNDVTPEYIPRALHDRIALYTGSIAGNICNVTIVKERLAEVGYFDESMTIAADFDMWVKLTEKYDIGMIKAKLVCQRVHTKQLSRAPEHYILHMREERRIFKNLFDRVDEQSKAFGRKNIKWRKNPLYFSFMLQSLKRRKWNVAHSFYKELSETDNVFLLGMRWMYLKFGRLVGIRIGKANDFLFEDLPSTKPTAMKATAT